MPTATGQAPVFPSFRPLPQKAEQPIIHTPHPLITPLHALYALFGIPGRLTPGKRRTRQIRASTAAINHTKRDRLQSPSLLYHSTCAELPFPAPAAVMGSVPVRHTRKGLLPCYASFIPFMILPQRFPVKKRLSVMVAPPVMFPLVGALLSLLRL